MKLYYAEVLNPRKVCAVAKYLDAPVEYVEVALHKGEHMTAPFRARNPNAKLPVLEDGATILWESDAIMCHLAWHAGSDLWPRDTGQIEVVRWLSWYNVHLGRSAGQLYFQHVIKPKFRLGPPDAAMVEEALSNFRIFGQVLNDHLETRVFLVDEHLTIADFAVSATLPYADAARLPLDEFPAIARWRDRLDAIPAWRDPYPARKSPALDAR